MNSGNATIHGGSYFSRRLAGWNYLFDGTSWTLDPDWTDPKLAEIAELEARLAVLKGE